MRRRSRTELLKGIRDRCCLSTEDAARILRTPVETVEAWSAGVEEPPANAIEELRALEDLIERRAAAALDAINQILTEQGDALEAIKIGLSASDAEAQKFGLPCLAAHVAMVSHVMARAPCAVKLVLLGGSRQTASPAPAQAS